MQTFKSLISKHIIFIKYSLWGILTVFISLTSFGLFSLIFSLSDLNKITAATVSNILSWLCVVIIAFITNKLFVFKSKSFNKWVLWPEFLKFFFSRLTTGIIEIVSLPLLMQIGLNQPLFGIEGMVSKIIVSIIVILLNYIFSRLFVFKKYYDGGAK